jgi:hypothetical protein
LGIDGGSGGGVKGEGIINNIYLKKNKIKKRWCSR